MKEIFFDDDTFNYRKERTIELCKKLKPLNFTWSCTSRVTTDYDTLKAMKEAGCRLLIVGYESGDPQILKNIKKGATVEMAERFTANCKKLGLVVHGDFIIGLPGETRESIRKTIDFAKRLDTETIQVSIAHPYPGTEFYDYVKKNNLITIDSMTDETGHQLPNIIYPGLDRGELVDWVERFYGEYFFRPRVVWRIVRKAIFNGDERRRLTKEAREYMALRSKRKKFVADHKAAKPAPRPQLRRLGRGHDGRIRAASREDLDLRRGRGAQQRVRQFLPEARHARGAANQRRRWTISPSLFRALGGAGRGAADSVDAVAHGAAELGRPELCAAGDLRSAMCWWRCWARLLLNERITVDALGGYRADHGGRGAGERRHAAADRAQPRGGSADEVGGASAIIVAATTSAKCCRPWACGGTARSATSARARLGRALAVLARNRFVIGVGSRRWRFRSSPIMGC